MASWVQSSYTNGRGAKITVNYTASYNSSTNKTTVTIQNYVIEWATGGASAFCEFAGTLFTARGDGVSEQQIAIYQSKSGNSPSVTVTVGTQYIFTHTFDPEKDIRLRLVTTVINAATYRPTNINASEVFHIAVYVSSGVHIDNGSGWDRYQPYIDTGSGWVRYGARIDNGGSWDNY